MTKLLQILSDQVRESFGNPVRLRRFLGDRPHFKADVLAPEDNIDMARVPKWHRLNETGWGGAHRRAGRLELMGWRNRGNYYSSFTQSCPALGSLVRHTVVDAWTCDLQDVHGFAASKSNLEKFRSTDEMVLTNSEEMITDVSAEGLRNNLAHNEIGLLREKPSDWFQVTQWDKRMFVVNSGGSHHLAAAKYIAARINAPVTLRAPLHYYSIDPDAVALLRGDYDIYLVNHEPELINAFSNAMQSSAVTWLWHDMPQPYENTRAIFLPREDALSMRVSQAFREAGFAELGQHLEDVARSGTPEIIMKRLRSQDQTPDECDDETDNSAPRA